LFYFVLFSVLCCFGVGGGGIVVVKTREGLCFFFFLPYQRKVMVDAKGRQQQQLNIAVAVVRGGTYLVEAGIVDSSIWSGKGKKKRKEGREGFPELLLVSSCAA